MLTAPSTRREPEKPYYKHTTQNAILKLQTRRKCKKLKQAKASPNSSPAPQGRKRSEDAPRPTCRKRAQKPSHHAAENVSGWKRKSLLNCQGAGRHKTPLKSLDCIEVHARRRQGKRGKKPL
jgi:hypothetical protein